MSLETVRVSQRAKDQLVLLKRRTGIKNWNVLCRWALCVSLADARPPRDESFATDSNVEMTWRTFGGDHEQLYLGILEERCIRDGIEPTDETLATQFRLHLHRGIAFLAGDPDIRSIRDLVGLATDQVC